MPEIIQHPVISARDLQLVDDLRQLEIKPMSEVFNVASGKTDIPVAVAKNMMLELRPYDLGEDFLKLMERYGNDIDHPALQKRAALKSTLGQCGVHLRFSEFAYGPNEGLTVEADLIFILSAERNGKLVFPVAHALERGSSIGEIVLIPEEATPLNATEFGDALAQQRIRARESLQYSESDGQVHIPLGDIQFYSEGVLSLPPDELSAVIRHGKRAFFKYRPIKPPEERSSVIEARFGIYASGLHAQQGFTLLIDENTTHPDVKHVAATKLKLFDPKAAENPRDPTTQRMWELVTERDDIPISSVKIKGDFYEQRRIDKTSARIFGPQLESVSYQEIVHSSEINDSPTTALSHQEVRDLTNLITTHSRKVSGLVITRSGKVCALPVSSGKPFSPGPLYVASEGQAPDEAERRSVLGKELISAIEQHPGVEVIKQYLAHGAVHTGINALISPKLPSPEDIEFLSRSSTAGIGTFICSDLSSGDPERFPSWNALKKLSELTSGAEPSAQILWLPENAQEFRKMAGFGFCQLSKLDAYRHPDFTLTLYTSNGSGKLPLEKIEPQFQQLIEGLDKLERRVFLATHNSFFGFEALAQYVEQASHVDLFAIESMTNGLSNIDSGHAVVLPHRVDEWYVERRILRNIGEARLVIGNDVDSETNILEDIRAMKVGGHIFGAVGTIDIEGNNAFSHVKRSLQEMFSPLGHSRISLEQASYGEINQFIEYGVTQWMRNPLQTYRLWKVPTEIRQRGTEAYIKSCTEMGRFPAEPLQNTLKHLLSSSQ
ncbi:hypothetical protein EBR25_11785 [bacterium]|nr:hypothetical protein [bacterium]